MSQTKKRETSNFFYLGDTFELTKYERRGDAYSSIYIPLKDLDASLEIERIEKQLEKSVLKTAAQGGLKINIVNRSSSESKKVTPGLYGQLDGSEFVINFKTEGKLRKKSVLSLETKNASAFYKILNELFDLYEHK